MKILAFFGLLLLTANVTAQMKVMEHDDKGLWNRIRNVNISNSGDHVLYSIGPEEKDQTLALITTSGEEVMAYPRSKGGRFTYDSKYVVLSANAYKDSILEMKRKKVKKTDMPKDTLIIYDITNNTYKKVPRIKSYRMPEKWSGVVTYMLDTPKPPKKDKAKSKKDTAQTKKKDAIKKAKKKLKKVSKDNGYHLVIHNLESSVEDTLKYVHSYAIAKEGHHLVYATSGEVDSLGGGVYHYDVDKATRTLLLSSHHKTKYPQLGISDSGKRVGFVVDADSTKSLIKMPKLYTWNLGDDGANMIVDSETNGTNMLVSKDARLRFSENENRLFFGLRTQPIVQDTTLLKEEIVKIYGTIKMLSSAVSNEALSINIPMNYLELIENRTEYLYHSVIIEDIPLEEL